MDDLLNALQERAPEDVDVKVCAVSSSLWVFTGVVAAAVAGHSCNNSVPCHSNSRHLDWSKQVAGGGYGSPW